MKYTSIHNFFLSSEAFNNSISEYNLGAILVNVFVYITVLLIIFCIIFSLNTKYFKTVNDFKNLTNYPFLYMSIMFSLLSLAGIPPLCGFTGKFMLVSSMFAKH